MDILILGNGFDLAHGLKTSYKDFLEYCKQTNLQEDFRINLWLKHFITRQNELGDTWIDLENEIYRVICNLKELPAIRNGGVKSQLCPQLLSLPENVFNFNFSQIEKYLRKPINNYDTNEKEYTADIPFAKEFCVYIKTSKGFVNFLYEQLREFTHIFEKYLIENVLSSLNSHSKYMLSVKDSDGQHKDKDLYILSFNYTNTCEKLYNGVWNSYCKFNIKPYYVHGKICNSDGCNLVLGTHSFDNKNSSSYTTPIPVNFNVFRKHNQRHRYGTIRDYQELLVQLTFPKRIIKPVFHVIGHSLDKTDHNILKHIFLINKNAKINLYYHNKESQENLINNITEIIGEEEVMSKVRLIYQHDEKYGILKPVK